MARKAKTEAKTETKVEEKIEAKTEDVREEAKAEETVAPETEGAPAAEEIPAVEEKAPAAEKAPAEKAKETEVHAYSDAEIKAIVDAAVAKAMAGKTEEDDGVVTLLFIGGIAKGTTVSLEGLGKIPRDGNILTVRKKDFFTNLGAVADTLLRKRKLIVADGLTDDERARYGVLYKEGELLTADRYQKLLDFDAQRLGGIYAALCPEHRELVTRVFHSAFLDGDRRVNAAKLKAMIRVDREHGVKESPLTMAYRTLTENIENED